jgi:soluble lytic murein transglycosylase-like protein
MRKILVLVASVGILAVATTPTQALQVDVRRQQVVRTPNHKRIMWLAEVKRIRARLRAEWEAEQAEQAAEALPTYYPPVTGSLTAAQVASYARGAGFPESVIPTMVAIAARESGFNPGAINSSSGACGLWQMYPCPGSEALNPATNAAMAYAKYAASGLSPWGF